MEIKDLAGLSEPLKKLIEVIAQGTGAVYKPYLIRKTAEAKAEELRLLTDAKAHQIRMLTDSIDYSRKKLGKADFQTEDLSLISPTDTEIKLLTERAASRREFQEAVEQANIEEITSHAAQELNQEESVSSESVDTDWIHRFFEIAKGVSNEEMQMIWGKILAGEIKHPETYSLRTLEVLRNLTKREAETFVKVAKLAIYDNSAAFIIKNEKYLQETSNIFYRDILLLQELGLLVAHETLGIVWKKQDEAAESFSTHLIYANHIVFFEYKGRNQIDIPIYGFTEIGRQLLNLIDQEFDLNFLRKIALYFKRGEFNLKYGKVLKVVDGRVYHSSLSPLSLDTEND